ncbi:MAG TPA: BTAD domain-containing putative transcriptional regulator [Chloroflexota bacterium]|nr:BTAD domain-containing putative transcriptional regulator [Chloroflexota bacterium]
MRRGLHSVAQVPAAACCGLTVLGPFALTRDESALDTSTWPRRGQSLLRLLAVSPEHRRRRDEVVELLWPESAPEASVSNLRSLVHLLKKHWGDELPPVVLHQGWVELNPELEWQIDLDCFEQQLRAASDDVFALQEALEMVRGGVLAEDRYEDWAALPRQRIEHAWREGCYRLVGLMRAAGDLQQALVWIERLLAYDSLDETAFREELCVLGGLGRRNDALRRARIFREHLTRELGVELSSETEALISGLTRQVVTEPVRSRTWEQDRDFTHIRSPLKTPVTPTNLPADLTPFVGRQQDIARLADRLLRPGMRLLTVTGLGGLGKTRLARKAAEAVIDHFPDGVILVQLDAVVDPDLVPEIISSTIGASVRAGSPAEERIIEHVNSRRVLLLLDNFEQLVAASSLLTTLLSSCPGLTLLLTSRTILHLSFENEFPLQPLAVPPPGAPDDPLSLLGFDSVQLFVQRADAVAPGFTLSDSNAAAVAEICRRLEGLPLAIELAAARTKLFPPHALLGQLTGRLDFLKTEATDRPGRQQTMWGAIDLSFQLLSADERTLFARLSVFRGGCSLEAAAAVCDLHGSLDLLRLFEGLIDKSLLRQEGVTEPWFQMLETIREYAALRLEERGEAEEVGRRHAEYVARRATEI